MHLAASVPGIAALPRLPLARTPTPVERSRALSSALGCELYVKRDDLSGELYGGNKIRKLEFLLAAARDAGKDTLVTSGGVGSHHVLATALYGGRLGFEVAAILTPQPLTAHVERTLEQILGAGVVAALAPGVARAPLAAAGLYAQLLRRGRRVAAIPPGGSSALGSLGYVEAALELAADVAAGRLPPPDLLVAPFGSGGTAVGLAVGAALAGLRAEVLGVGVFSGAAAGAAMVAYLRSSTERLLMRHGAEAAQLAPRRPLSVDAAALGRGYGHPTPAALAAVEEARRAGLGLETTYSGKALAALFARRASLAGKVVVFWNTFSSIDTSGLRRVSSAAFLKERLGARRVAALYRAAGR